MTAEPDAIHYRRIRAPREDGQALVEPSLTLAVDRLRGVQAGSTAGSTSLVATDGGSADEIDCLGKTLAQLSREARQELLRLAVAYTSQYRDADASSVDMLATQPIAMAGHQPTLFHPGVWFKNFTLSALAERSGATALNLVVDNDTLRAASIRVPTGSASSPIFENIPFDASSDERPFEERPLLDRSVFDSFAERVEGAMASLVAASPQRPYTPLVRRYWALARQLADQHASRMSLGCLLAAARHKLEGELGLRTLELPLSSACDTAAFRWFVVWLLSEMPRLAEVYNELLAEYRRVNHVRSRSHPVPDLARDDGWIEAPLWIWTADDPRRRHLFVRATAKGLEITNRAGLVELLPLARGGDAAAAVERLGELRARGIKLRPRALMTTMFSRLLVGDVFLHGIGGAKYDELTDAIIARFFGIEPPLFLTVTATFQLPIERPPLSPETLLGRQQRLRDVKYHPERFAADVPAAARDEFDRLVMQKRELLASRPAEPPRRPWHAELASVNERMATILAPLARQLVVEQPKLAEELLAAQRLGSREFSFVLFPEETLPGQLKQLCE